MGNSLHLGPFSLVTLVSSALLIAACGGCSVDTAELHVVSEAPTAGHNYLLHVAHHAGAPVAPVRPNRLASQRLLRCSLTLIAATTVVFLLLKCAPTVGWRQMFEEFQRSLAAGGDEGLPGVCGGFPEGRGAETAAAASSGNVDYPLEQPFSKVLRKMEGLAKSLKETVMLLPAADRVSWLGRFQVFCSLEFGSQAAILTGTLEAKRKEALHRVKKAVGKVLDTVRRDRTLASPVHRLKRQLGLLNKIMENEREAAPLTEAERREKLKALIEVQEAAVAMAASLVKELASLLKQDPAFAAQESSGLVNLLEALNQKRKLQLLRDPLYAECLLALEEQRGHHLLFMQRWLPAKLSAGPPAPPEVQIEELRVALAEARSSGVRGPPGTDAPSQRVASGSESQGTPSDVSLHEPERGKGSVPPPAPGDATVPLTAPREGQPSKSLKLSGLPESSVAASSAFSLSAEAAPFFPRTQSKAPGAHAKTRAFYGDPLGRPAPLSPLPLSATFLSAYSQGEQIQPTQPTPPPRDPWGVPASLFGQLHLGPVYGSSQERETPAGQPLPSGLLHGLPHEMPVQPSPLTRLSSLRRDHQDPLVWPSQPSYAGALHGVPREAADQSRQQTDSEKDHKGFEETPDLSHGDG